jgi:hypothetical protein
MSVLLKRQTSSFTKMLPASSAAADYEGQAALAGKTLENKILCPRIPQIFTNYKYLL